VARTESRWPFEPSTTRRADPAGAGACSKDAADGLGELGPGWVACDVALRLPSTDSERLRTVVTVDCRSPGSSQAEGRGFESRVPLQSTGRESFAEGERIPGPIVFALGRARGVHGTRFGSPTPQPPQDLPDRERGEPRRLAIAVVGRAELADVGPRGKELTQRDLLLLPAGGSGTRGTTRPAGASRGRTPPPGADVRAPATRVRAEGRLRGPGRGAGSGHPPPGPWRTTPPKAPGSAPAGLPEAATALLDEGRAALAKDRGACLLHLLFPRSPAVHEQGPGFDAPRGQGSSSTARIRSRRALGVKGLARNRTSGSSTPWCTMVFCV